MDPVTVTIRGGGGDEFDMDVPAPGTERRAQFDQFVRDGVFVVIEGEIPEPEEDEDEPTDLERLKVAELEALADEKGIDLGGATKKADIVAVLGAALATLGPDEDDDE